MLFGMSLLPDNLHSVIFDFDFTLVDSSPVIIESVSYAFRKMSLTAPTPDLILRTINLAHEDALKMLVPTLNSGKTKEFLQLASLREAEIMDEKTQLIDGVKDVLYDLDARGLCLGIVSNKSRDWIERILQSEKLESVIDAIVGIESTAKQNPIRTVS
jgi:phosphoglycolate phosphatase